MFYWQWLLILESVVLYAVSAYFFFRAWKLTKHPSYLAIGSSYVLLIIAFVIMTCTAWIPYRGNKAVVYNLFKTYLFISLFSFGILVNSLLIIKSGAINSITQFPTLLLGMLMGLLLENNNIIIAYYSKLGIWYYDHPIIIKIIFSIVFTVYFLLIVQYLYIKHKVSRKRSRLAASISLVGMLFIIIWISSSFFNSGFWYFIRLITAPPAMFFIALSLYIDPLNFLYTKGRITKIALLNENHGTLIYFDLRTGKKSEDKIQPDLIRAAGLLVKEYGGEKIDFNNPDNSVWVRFDQLEFKKMKVGRLFVIAFGSKIDLNITATFVYISNNIQQIIDFEHLELHGTLTPEEEEKIISEITSGITSIYA